MIILRSPKGWTGPLSEHGVQLLNRFVSVSSLLLIRALIQLGLPPALSPSSFASHQVPLPGARTDPSELAHLEKWLLSYEPEKIFNRSKTEKGEGFSILNKIFDDSLPVAEKRRLGFVKEAYDAFTPLDLGDWKTMGYEKGKEEIRCAFRFRSRCSRLSRKLAPASLSFYSRRC
jgi:xylulose-5-phosphate/fructose-6-phosphate phosphoketolase